MTASYRWLTVPVLFGSCLLLSVFVRWLPLAMATLHESGGLGRVIAGDLILFWGGSLRTIVALFVTVVLFRFLPSPSWRGVIAVSLTAVGAEWIVQFTTAGLVGVQASLIVQLVATGLAFGGVLLISAVVLHRGRRHVGCLGNASGWGPR